MFWCLGKILNATAGAVQRHALQLCNVTDCEQFQHRLAPQPLHEEIAQEHHQSQTSGCSRCHCRPARGLCGITDPIHPETTARLHQSSEKESHDTPHGSRWKWSTLQRSRFLARPLDWLLPGYGGRRENLTRCLESKVDWCPGRLSTAGTAPGALWPSEPHWPRECIQKNQMSQGHRWWFGASWTLPLLPDWNGQDDLLSDGKALHPWAGDTLPQGRGFGLHGNAKVLKTAVKLIGRCSSVPTWPKPFTGRWGPTNPQSTKHTYKQNRSEVGNISQWLLVSTTSEQQPDMLTHWESPMRWSFLICGKRSIGSCDPFPLEGLCLILCWRRLQSVCTCRMMHWQTFIGSWKSPRALNRRACQHTCDGPYKPCTPTRTFTWEVNRIGCIPSSAVDQATHLPMWCLDTCSLVSSQWLSRNCVLWTSWRWSTIVLNRDSFRPLVMKLQFHIRYSVLLGWTTYALRSLMRQQ